MALNLESTEQNAHKFLLLSALPCSNTSKPVSKRRCSSQAPHSSVCQSFISKLPDFRPLPNRTPETLASLRCGTHAETQTRRSGAHTASPRSRLWAGGLEEQGGTRRCRNESLPNSGLAGLRQYRGTRFRFLTFRVRRARVSALALRSRCRQSLPPALVNWSLSSAKRKIKRARATAESGATWP